MRDINLQALINGMNAEAQKERAEEQMALGGMIKWLEELPEDLVITGLGDLHSYRGYYCDLSFEPTTEGESVLALLARCKDAMGQVFKGYKGGDYVMGALTPLWVANYGDCGLKLMGLNEDGSIETLEYY